MSAISHCQSIHEIFNIPEVEFNSLFSEDINTDVINKLSESAANGNVNNIDLLYNIALQKNNSGDLAEKALFDLFSGKKRGKIGVEYDIQQAGLKLYEIANHAKVLGYNNMEKLHSPSKLLYIVGSAIQNSEVKKTLSNILQQNQCIAPEDDFIDVDLWGANRLITTDEINFTVKKISFDNHKLSVNYPIGLVNEHSNENNLSSHVLDRLNSNQTELFPVNTGEHWVLFGLYKNKTADCEVMKGFLFNSYLPLNEDAKNKILDSANIAGVANENVEWIESNIQDNVPNGCGVFVFSTIREIMEHIDNDPINTINDFIDNFKKQTKDSQEVFNLYNRRQLYEYCINPRN
ncbi:MAG: ElaD/SseL family deubiquitinase [Plesiomonas sp.]|uniref:ElaD/SseL family deubiquitinase n=1 Tax=Plesiomonas sp. TaxID=2486279 RepID=UPI003F302EB4